MTEQGDAATSVYQEWSLLDDRLRWRGPVETLLGLPRSRIGSGSSFASALGAGGAERMAAIHRALSAPGGLFEARYEVVTRHGVVRVAERGQCFAAGDGRLALVRSILRPLAPRDEDVFSSPFFAALGPLATEGPHSGLLYLEVGAGLVQGAALLESALRPFLRQGDLFARLDQDSALAALRAADHDQVAVVARRIHALWRQQGELPPLRLAGIVAPKSGRSPALLFHRLLQARDIAVAGAAADLVFYSDQLTGRDSSLRRVVLGDDLVAQLNSRAITLSRRPVRQCDGDAALFYDLVGKAGALGAGLSALRPLYAPLDMAGLLDHRIAELSLAQCASSPHPVCLFLSALTAEQGWLDLIEAGAPRRGFDGRLIVDFPADDFALAPSDFRHVASRLRDLGCRLSVSGVAEAGDYPPLPFDFCRLGGLGLGDLARSADERFRHRRLVEAIKDSGARPVVPVEADAEARGFLVASGVDLVEGATVEGPQEAAFDASVAA